jgi:REP element-mobilizing transposase RayT
MQYKQEYHRNLPHIRPEHAPYFLTDRLVDTLPKAAIDRLLQMRRELKAAKDPKAEARLFKYVEDLLDAGEGPTWLGDPRVAEIVMHEFNALPEFVTLKALCVMPNHTHSVITVEDANISVTEMLRRLKGRSARFANQVLQRQGAFWQRETFDHIIRKSEWEAIVNYVACNPVKAGMVEHWSEWPYTYIAPELRYLLPAKASATIAAG